MLKKWLVLSFFVVISLSCFASTLSFAGDTGVIFNKPVIGWVLAVGNNQIMIAIRGSQSVVWLKEISNIKDYELPVLYALKKMEMIEIQTLIFFFSDRKSDHRIYNFRFARKEKSF